MPGSELKFLCKHCGQALEAESDMAGETLNCPACEKLIKVPQMINNVAHIKQTQRNGVVWGILSIIGFILILTIFQITSHYASRVLGDRNSNINLKTETRLPQKLSIDEKPYIIEVNQGIDKNLTFLRYLDVSLSSFPDLGEDQDLFATEIANFRRIIFRAKEFVKDTPIDNRFIKILDAKNDLLDKYIEYIVNTSNIDEAAIARAQKETTEASYVSGVAAGKTFSAARNQDINMVGSGILGLGVYALSMWLQDQEQGVARDQARQELILREQKELDSAMNSFQSLSRSIIKQLEKDYNWHKGESGLDIPAEMIELRQNAFLESDIRVLNDLFKTEASLRPRDPFLYVLHGIFSLYLHEEAHRHEPISYEKISKNLLTGVSLLPTDNFYDEIRSIAFFFAAYAEFKRATPELDNKGYSAGPYNTEKTIQLLSSSLKYNPYDSEGLIRVLKGIAYASAGNFDKAIEYLKAIEPYFLDDNETLYDFVKIYSVAGLSNKANELFKTVVKSGNFTEISDSRKHPDLNNLRRNFSKNFESLTSIKTEVKIYWALIFYDSITLRNLSYFPLTNVQLNLTLFNQGKRYTASRQVSLIRPNQGRKFYSIFRVPGSRYDSFAYSVQCDQGEATIRVK